MTSHTGRPAEATWGRIQEQFWRALSVSEYQTFKEIMRASGRASNGGPVYLSLMNSMVFSGQVEMRTMPTKGRPIKGYRKVRDTFYNTKRDNRFVYKHWSELADTVQEQARERYAGGYEWLRFEDWLYPVTVKEVKRLGKGERVLNLTVEEAETKRITWRERFAVGIM